MRLITTRQLAWLLFTLGIVAFIAAGPVRHVLRAYDRKREKLTMVDMRTIAMVLEERAMVTKSYHVGPPPRANVGKDGFAFGALHPIPYEQVSPKLPLMDQWGSPFQVRAGAYDAHGRAQTYAIRSLGKDRRADADRYTHEVNTRFEQDIVFTDGNFIRYPEGI